MADWRARAKAGDEWATEMLLSRPALSVEAVPYWQAFQHLDPYRPRQTLGGGMGPAIILPLPIPRAEIRTEGQRLGYDGEGLDDFCEIVEFIDHAFIEITAKREADRARAAAAQAKQRNSRR